MTTRLTHTPLQTNAPTMDTLSCFFKRSVPFPCHRSTVPPCMLKPGVVSPSLGMLPFDRQLTVHTYSS
jgi:hypothetical protein